MALRLTLTKLAPAALLKLNRNAPLASLNVSVRLKGRMPPASKVEFTESANDAPPIISDTSVVFRTKSPESEYDAPPMMGETPVVLKLKPAESEHDAPPIVGEIPVVFKVISPESAIRCAA